MAEGLTGIFKDFDNNFSCDSVEEWTKHLADTETTHKGNAPCITCGTVIDFEWTGKLKNGLTYPQVLCKECKSQ